ncbi:MAG: type II toxin-antitoxin system VapC family toxin [Candidatus Poribacteria bacterium]|nr:type II toxin-antitoxin system VapC family toxin [Candidatus Poribacteria bacterium]
MLKYTAIKPSVYIESTVVSYLVARPSDNPILASRQKVSQRLWEDYADRFEFVISSIVRDEIRQGDANAAQRQLEFISSLRVLELLPEIDILAQKLLDAGAIPRNSESDAQHIAIATVHRVEYLVSWNHKHIVNKNKREHINQVCQAAGFQPTTICTPIELMEDTQMKEAPEKHPDFDPETYTDPILEECYRIKAEISAKFKKPGEYYKYLKALEEEDKRNGVKYVSYYDPSKRIPVEKSDDT